MKRPPNYTVQIPTKPHLAKFVSAQYGTPVLLDNYSLFGVVVLSLLQKTVCTHYNIQAKHQQFRNYTDKLICIAPMLYMSSYGIDITDDNIIQLNRYFDHMFAQELFYFVKHNASVKRSRYNGHNSAIEGFALKYGISIEEHVTMECLKKTYYRFRKRNEIILANNVPTNKSISTNNLFSSQLTSA